MTQEILTLTPAVRSGRSEIAALVVIASLAAIVIFFWQRHLHEAILTPEQRLAITLGVDAVGRNVGRSEWQATVPVMPRSKTARVVFDLSSPTGMLLKVRNINVSCACTGIVDPPSAIPATGTARFLATVTLLEKSGPYETTVVIATDSLAVPYFKLQIKGNVQP